MNKNSQQFSIYNYPQLYDDIMYWKQDDIQFWQSILNKFKSQNVLELCCGTGRLGIPFINHSIDYYGLDSSDSFISFFHKKIKLLNYNNTKITCDNATSFSFDKKFDFILIGFNSLAHLLTDQDVMNCLQCVKNHMHDKSIFAIDIFMPTHQLIANLKSQKIEIMDFIDSTNDKRLSILESTEYNASTEVNHIVWDFMNNNNKEFSYGFDMRIFFPDTLNRMLTDAGFIINHFYGDYQFNKFNEHSEKQIYICSK